MEKIIHQIWVGPYEIPNMEKFFMKQLKEKNPEFTHILWTDKNIPELHPIIKKHVDYHAKDENYAFVADVLRIMLIREFGGIYMDVDWECHKGFGDLQLEKYDGLIVYHNEYTSGNEVFGSSAKSKFIEHMYQKMLITPISHTFMPYWFNSNLKEYYNIVDTWERNKFTSEEFEDNGKMFLQLMKNDNILALRKWGEFEKIYLSHHGLYSWENEHKKMFKEGNINYKDEYCKIRGFNYDIDKITPKEQIGDKIKIIKATYGNADVKNIIETYCIKNNVMTIPVNNDTFTDTLPNVYKQMIIEFEYEGNLIKEIVNEGLIFKYPK